MSSYVGEKSGIIKKIDKCTNKIIDTAILEAKIKYS